MRGSFRSALPLLLAGLLAAFSGCALPPEMTRGRILGGESEAPEEDSEKTEA